MQTQLSPTLQNDPRARAGERILRSCVHCGFCNATCPTYQLAGDELDGPRGRIYQIKQLLEDGPVSRRTLRHLDRCLTCRACESTCPSGVRYGELLEVGRELIEARGLRPRAGRAARRAVRAVLLSPVLLGALLKTGRTLRPLLPRGVRGRIPHAEDPGPWPAPRHARRVLLPRGCVQGAAAPAIDAAAARLLDGLGVSAIAPGGGGCCGALSHHLGAEREARERMRRNIDVWWPYLEAGAEAIVSTASGCGVHIKDYGRLFADDPAYAARAARISAATRDLAEFVGGCADAALTAAESVPRRIAVHSPCTLQHGQRLPGIVEGLLERAGFTLAPVSDEHLCCGSAGAYSLLHPRLAAELRRRKLAGLLGGAPEAIATANIGCLLHLGAAAPVPVRHWVHCVRPAGAPGR